MKIHELLTDESKWTQGSLARTNLDMAIHAQASDATCWCLVGAVHKCYGATKLPNEIIQRIHDKVGNLAKYNNSHTFAEVRQLVLELDI